ncbi:SNF2 helicase associated domain-containing protein [Clostridium sp. PL3]|uniref:SNF2 helicase associated domain-containing protein n=1 Tax=Clostridium thailandense TaxID=2794346 RepID=A0A949TTS2_9CLOT|nr:SNF2 helicase associated domain-containing protein [Clostridium thailandense]MBV7271741.1 SNF2 helicase associated domain-containing protein [Clostridium thailandense]
MLKEDMLLQIFNEETSGKNQLKGQRVFNNDLISSLDITSEDNLICISSNVISENLFNEYSAKIELDTSKKSIFSTYCSCGDYEKNEFNKRNYCCKHLVATFYKAVGDLAKHPLLNEENYNDKKEYKNNLLFTLLEDENDKEQIKIEIYIDKNDWNHNLMAEFRIGLNTTSSSNLYVLKDINQFLVGMYNNVPINYGKNFIFDMRNQRLTTKDKRLIDFIETLKEIEKNQNYVNRNGFKIIDGKYINIPNYLVREFFQVVRRHRVYLNEGFFCRNFETEILFDSPAVEFDLKLIKDEYVLKSPGGMPEVLGSKNDVFLYGTTIYLPDYEFCYKISPYLRVFNESKVVVIPSSEEKTILKRLVPDLNELSPNVTLSKPIKDKIVMEECKFNFYFDKEENNVTLTVKVQYGAYEFNIFEDCKEKVIYRNSKKETEVKVTIRNLGFEEIEGKYYLVMGEEYIFRFFKSEIFKFQELGEVYYSENFKGIKYIGTKGISGDIKAGKYNYFELDFTIAGINPQETAHILRAFRDNLKYYKLKNGEYLDLEQLELKRFLKLLDIVSSKDIDNNHIEISKNRAAFIADYLEESNIRYIKGNKELKEIRDKLKNAKKLKFEVPLDLKGILREYQKLGFNWFKTLDYLGFGGILGDEMGLGKTLQTIAFILSNKSSKSLIVAPTSLVYNWLSEFEKFAPSVKVKVVNGLKEDREEIIKNIESYDVIITTYNLLKRDLESYRNLEFDYCILDEAQNIKNYNSQNAIAVKEIKAKNRFALSGTPIENSLMELWSIFDFIMPGYLYDEKRFSVRYHKKLRESPEVLEDLNRLIKPFILRRKKREVIKELPDKIEKTLVVDLEDEQKKIYKAYANYAVELIQKRVKDYEFQNSKIEILAYITKLRQICLDPSILMKDYSGSSGKLEALAELLNKTIEESHRVLVFSQFTSVLKNIGKRISADGISFSYLDGTMTSDKRMKTVKSFNDGETSVFLISLKAGGTGLNLTSADVVIHFDPWWNPSVEEQATDRAHRIGQKNVVQVIKIIAKGTIEEKIISLQEEKKKLISQLMGDDFSKGSGLVDLSQEQIMELFRV